jgi:hypothetical protein
MAKPLTKREAELLRLVLMYAKNYDDSNPDAGWKSVETVAKEALQTLSFEIDEDDIAEALEEIRGN